MCILLLAIVAALIYLNERYNRSSKGTSINDVLLCVHEYELEVLRRNLAYQMGP